MQIALKCPKPKGCGVLDPVVSLICSKYILISTHCVDRYPTQLINQNVKPRKGEEIRKNTFIALYRQFIRDVNIRADRFRRVSDHTLKCVFPAYEVVQGRRRNTCETLRGLKPDLSYMCYKN
ncbi:hypothetical protein AVEN_211679-1 [Araneus ventricosus]|uniref:Uncharacterized protein n=1 Tax=Araneus ventricosus TaxID=182803 RepID=A0A4Y2QBB3_ARAVE|nr:hypothetical protein AVEN_211679-1 [Araneus ventricosus]